MDYNDSVATKYCIIHFTSTKHNDKYTNKMNIRDESLPINNFTPND